MVKAQGIKKSLIIISFIAIAILQYIRPKDQLPQVSSEATNYTLDPSVFSILSLGQDKLISSYYWMTTLLFSDHEHVKDQKNSWKFYRFKLISKLNPSFYENYKYGGLYLSIVKDDLIGAETIYGLGLERFKNDEFLLWNRGFNLCMEMNQCKKALPYFLKLSEMNSSRYPLSSRIASKIKAGLGLKTEAFSILKQNYLEMEEGPIKRSTYRTLYNLKASIDLECLNSLNKNKECDHLDLEGRPYKREDSNYVSNKPEWKDRIYLNKKGEQ